MAVTACIAGTEYTGPTLAEIIDREYGDGAFASRDNDPNAAQWGKVLRKADGYSYHVLDSIYWVEGEDEILDQGEALCDLERVAGEIASLDNQRGGLVKQRDALILRLVNSGAPVVDISRAGNVSRNHVYVVKNR